MQSYTVDMTWTILLITKHFKNSFVFLSSTIDTDNMFKYQNSGWL